MHDTVEVAVVEQEVVVSLGHIDNTFSDGHWYFAAALRASVALRELVRLPIRHC